MDSKQKIKLLVPLYIVLPLGAIAAARFQHQQPSDWGWQWDSHLGYSFLWGGAIAIVTISLIYSIEIGCGWLKWQQNGVTSQLFQQICLIAPLALLVGFAEELIFRGYIQYQLETKYGVLIAGIVASTIFALLHLVWSRKQTLPQLPGLWLMGMVLLTAKLADGNSLGLAWGLHSGWVWSLACIDATGVFGYTKTSPEWFVGVGKQPLAGMAGILCMLVTVATLWLFVRVNSWVLLN